MVLISGSVINKEIFTKVFTTIIIIAPFRPGNQYRTQEMQLQNCIINSQRKTYLQPKVSPIDIL